MVDSTAERTGQPVDEQASSGVGESPGPLGDIEKNDSVRLVTAAGETIEGVVATAEERGGGEEDAEPARLIVTVYPQGGEATVTAPAGAESGIESWQMVAPVGSRPQSDGARVRGFYYEGTYLTTEWLSVASVETVARPDSETCAFCGKSTLYPRFGAWQCPGCDRIYEGRGEQDE